MLCNSLTQQLSCNSLDIPNSSWFPQGLKEFHNAKEQLLRAWGQPLARGQGFTCKWPR